MSMMPEPGGASHSHLGLVALRGGITRPTPLAPASATQPNSDDRRWPLFTLPSEFDHVLCEELYVNEVSK